MHSAVGKSKRTLRFSSWWQQWPQTSAAGSCGSELHTVQKEFWSVLPDGTFSAWLYYQDVGLKSELWLGHFPRQKIMMLPPPCFFFFFKCHRSCSVFFQYYFGEQRFPPLCPAYVWLMDRDINEFQWFLQAFSSYSQVLYFIEDSAFGVTSARRPLLRRTVTLLNCRLVWLSVDWWISRLLRKPFQHIRTYWSDGFWRLIFARLRSHQQIDASRE